MKKCLYCGSTRLIADRALSGRIICISCGNPYGMKQKNNYLRYNHNVKIKSLIYLILMIIVFIIIVKFI